VYREEGVNDVGLDGAERLVSDDNEDLLLFFQVDEVTKPGFFGKSVGGKDRKKSVSAVRLYYIVMHTRERLSSFHWLKPTRQTIHKNEELVKSFFYLPRTNSLQLWGNGKEPTEDTLREIS